MGAAQRTGRVDGLAMLLAYRTCFARGRTVQRVTLLVAQIHSNNCYTYSGDTPSRTFNMNMMDSKSKFPPQSPCMYVRYEVGVNLLSSSSLSSLPEMFVILYSPPPPTSATVMLFIYIDCSIDYNSSTCRYRLHIISQCLNISMQG